jgi:hypothetical protein
MALSAAVLVGSLPAQAVPIAVDTELQLLVDVSGSVDDTEFALQRDGYVNAFKNAAIQALILDTDGGNRLGKLAVQFVYWSGSLDQAVGVAWTLIDSVAASDAFADAIAAAARPFADLTAPGSAINYATPLFASNDYDGKSWVIDVSGDGVQNDGDNTADARDAALLAGVDRINGLAIGNSTIFDFYEDNIQGGAKSFTLQAATFADFQDAVNEKLAFEASGGGPSEIPLPATALLLIGGLAGLGAAARRKAARAA